MYMFRSVKKLNKILFKLNKHKQAGSVDDPVDIALQEIRSCAIYWTMGTQMTYYQYSYIQSTWVTKGKTVLRKEGHRQNKDKHAHYLANKVQVPKHRSLMIKTIIILTLSSGNETSVNSQIVISTKHVVPGTKGKLHN